MINKIDSILKNKKCEVLTFLISLFIIGFIYNLNNVTPFGDKSLLCVDFYHQYGPMLGGLYNKVTNFENLIYSFNVGLGIPFFRNFFNYLSSPLNIIMFLFSKKNLLTSFSFIIGLKACFASTFMVYYLNKKNNTNNYLYIPIGILYGFSQYFSAYYWNIMWLDGMVLLPLITLGIENIINKGTWKLYLVSLSIMLFSNYFIGYMICIFSVFYFIGYLIYKTKFSLKNYQETINFIWNKIKIFAFASLMSGAILAVFLLPMFKSMFTISATGGSIPTSQYYLFTVRDFLESHLTGVKTTVFASDTITSPNISAGILSVILVILFIINPKIKLKTKLTYSFLLGLIIFSFFNPVADYIMHAFHVPNDLPYRYSFLYTFILLIMSSYSITKVNDIKFQITTIVYLLTITILLYLTMNNWDGITTNMIFINIILLTIYFILYCFNRFFKQSKIIVVSSLILFSMVEVIISINYNWNITQEIKNFYANYNETNEYLNYLKKNDKEKFYRLESTNMLTLNDGDWYGYNGINTFSSMAYESMAKFQNDLGIPGNEINSYYYQQTTPIYDILFDVKYLIGESNDYSRYEIADANYPKLTKFNYSNGLIFGVKKELLNTKKQDNPFTYENEIMKNATGIDNILTPAKYVKTEEIYSSDTGVILNFKYKNNFDNMYFYTDSNFIKFFIIGDTLYYLDDNYTDLTEKTNKLKYSYIDDYNEARIINILSTSDNIDITIGYNYYYDGEFEIYNINHSLFESASEFLKNYQFTYTEFKNDSIKGTIDIDDDMIIYTSIPYDEGWKVYVDGKYVSVEKFADTLITFKASKGKHKIEIKYTPPLQKLGLLISIVSIIILFLTKRVIKI